MINLNKEINFIPVDSLLEEVRLMLSSYYEKDMLDDVVFYPIIKEALSKLGAKIYPVNSKIIRIQNYKGKLPNDFYKLILALGCFDYTITTGTDSSNPKLYDITPEQFDDYLISKPSITGLDECGANFYLVQRFETFTTSYSSISPLSVSTNSMPYCTNNCFNKNISSPDQIQVDKHNSTLLTNFNNGFVYLEYLQNLEIDTEEGKDILIPDFGPIRRWIKALCIETAFKFIYFNNYSSETERKLMRAEKDTYIAETEAKSFTRRSDIDDFYNMRKVFFGRYNKFHQMVYGLPIVNRPQKISTLT